jgi:hypothetical protein
MQILKIWNNLFTKGLQIHSSFFIIFVSYIFHKIWQNLKFNQSNDTDLKKMYSPVILEFYLVFFYIFSYFFYFYLIF